MDPVSLTAISIGMSAAGGGVSAFGALQGGAAKKQMYGYQAALAERNAVVAKQNADYALRVGETQAQSKGMETRFKVGQTITNRGASGLDVNRGSNARVVQSVEDIGSHDAAVIRSDAAKRAFGYEVEASNQTAQGQVYRSAGEDASRGGKIAALGSILGAASSVSGKWTDATSRGIFGSGGSGWAGDSGYQGWIDNPDA